MSDDHTTDWLQAGLLDDYTAFFWTSVAINIISATSFTIGGCIRKKELKDYGQADKKISKLLWTKMTLFLVLLGVDFGQLLVLFIEVFRSHKIDDDASGDHELADSSTKDQFSKLPLFLLISVLITDLVNFSVYIFAVYLRYQEYVRHLSEVWYAHKLLIYSNLVMNCVHGLVFLHLHIHYGILAFLTLTRCCVFVGLAVCQCFTTQRSGADRVYNDTFVIKRSQTLLDQSELNHYNDTSKDGVSFMNPPSPQNNSFQTHNELRQRRSTQATHTRNLNQNKPTQTSLHIKIESIKIVHGSTILSFATHVRNLPKKFIFEQVTVQNTDGDEYGVNDLDADDSYVSATTLQSNTAVDRDPESQRVNIFQRAWTSVKEKFSSRGHQDTTADL